MKKALTTLIAFFIVTLVIAESERAKRAFAKLPEACQSTVLGFGTEIVLDEVEFEREGGAEVYEVEFLADGVPTEVEMTPDGSIVKVEQLVPYNALPEAIKAAIDWSPDSQRGIKITKTMRVSYEVQIEGKRGRERFNGFGKPAHPSPKPDAEKEEDDEGEKDD